MALLSIMTLERMTRPSVSIMGIGVEFAVLSGLTTKRYLASGGHDKLVHIWDARCRSRIAIHADIGGFTASPATPPL
ncbi:hypothetical protein MUK42_27560 [Musa troglodytarum]|uniref:Uncharacterized protein n=1 Tax=Musa troglodytarum TaxID=320322 RepID=A0A9E7ICC2_9LILI|nr:hypothetical protein MUK42_27560 [Musa troglodytarum]